MCHPPSRAEPHDDQDYYSKNNRENQEQAYYIGHPARRQGIISVPVICFFFVCFHVATGFVRHPPLPKYTSTCLPQLRQLAGKHRKQSTRHSSKIHVIKSKTGWVALHASSAALRSRRKFPSLLFAWQPHSDTNWAMRRTTTFLLGAAAAVAFAAAVISSRTGE